MRPLPETDASRIGIWGSSYSGGHVLVVGAIDRAATISRVAWCGRTLSVASIAMFEDDRRARYAGGPPAMIPVVSENPAGPAALPTPDSWTFFTETGRTRAPAWKNEVTLRSVEMFTEYEPGSYIGHISPTPLLLVVALGDHLTVADHALEAYERALMPKRLAMLNGGHFDAYEADFDRFSGAAADWFKEYLRA